MSLPALADVRRHFAGATLAVGARTGLAPLFESVPGVEAVVSLTDTGRALQRWRADAETLTSGQFDLTILFPNSFYAAWVVKQAAIPERWGYRSDWRSMLLTRAVGRPGRPIHQGAYYQHLVSELGLPSGPLTPHVIVADRDRSAGLALLVREGWAPSIPLVGLAPGAAYGFAKQWPPDRVAALAERLVEQGIWCVLVGGEKDRDAGQQVMVAFERVIDPRRAQGRVMNLIGRTDLRQLMGLMRHCGTVVANDSGAAHLAAAVGLPVVAIFGPTDERISAPLPGQSLTRAHAIVSHPVFCRPCMLRECPIDHRCMTRIDPVRVFDAVMQQLAGR